MAILVLVYPTFTMQSIAVAFSQHFITFALSALSLFLMVVGWNHRRFYWIAMPLAWVACGVSLFSMEYFVGLEALRYVLLGMLIFHSWKITRSGLRSFVQVGLPFMLILGVYLYYRLVLYPAQLGSIQANFPSLLLSADAGLLTRLGTLAIHIGQDILYLLFGAWAGIYTEINFQSKAFILGWVLGILTVGLVFFFFSPKVSPSESDTPRPPYKKLWLGLFIIMVAGLPVWSLGQQITIGKWSGRYSLAPLIGAAVVVVWLVERLVRTRLQRNILLAALMAFSIATQVQAINLYRKDWEVQRQLYWQLSWRAPCAEGRHGHCCAGCFSTDHARGIPGLVCPEHSLPPAGRLGTGPPRLFYLPAVGRRFNPCPRPAPSLPDSEFYFRREHLPGHRLLPLTPVRAACVYWIRSIRRIPPCRRVIPACSPSRTSAKFYPKPKANP